MLRVVIISPLPPQKTGESPYTAKLIEKLVELADVEIVAIAGPEADPLPNKEGRVQTYPIWEGRNLLYPFRLLRRIRKLKPHIVHVQFGPHGEVYGGLFGERMLILLLLLRLCGIKTTVTSHSTWMKNQVENRVRTYQKLGFFAPLAKGFFSIYMKLLDWGTDTIQLSTVKLSSALRRRFLEEYNISCRKVLEIPHPCREIEDRLDGSIARKQLGLDGRKILLVFGFIKRGKGLEQAVEAVKHLKEDYPEVILLIAGSALEDDDKKYLKEIRKLVEDSILKENVRIDAHYIPEDEIPTYYSAASAILVPYTESIGASGPIHNFAGYGTPIIASDVGLHNRESLGGEVIVYKPDNPKDLSEKIEMLLRDQKLVQKISKSQIAYTKKQSWIEGAKQTLENYRTTLKL
ncbi:MAG: glycosyltransferase [Candidatus Lokiarchaeota archaeon]|nr:glycosyltransferase [Candidatus Lokiarchaeota archaeon]